MSKPKIKLQSNKYLNKKELLIILKSEIAYHKELKKQNNKERKKLDESFILGMQAIVNLIKECPCDEVDEVVQWN